VEVGKVFKVGMMWVMQVVLVEGSIDQAVHDAVGLGQSWELGIGSTGSLDFENYGFWRCRRDGGGVEQDSEVEEIQGGGVRLCFSFQAFAFGAKVIHRGDKASVHRCMGHCGGQLRHPRSGGHRK
jgi:hypothetical protein